MERYKTLNWSFVLITFIAFTPITSAQTDISNQQRALTDAINSAVSEVDLKSVLTNNKSVLDNVSNEAVRTMQSKLPKFQEYGTELRFSNALTISEDGPAVIRLIRLAAQDRKKRETYLQEIKKYADNLNPEALNYVGFIHYHGLYGRKKNEKLADEYFYSSTKYGYSAAYYNMAITSIYKTRESTSLNQARKYLSLASQTGRDSSARVCGWRAFTAFRDNESAEAIQAATGCSSPLAELPLAVYSPSISTEKRIQLLRNSLKVGINDPFRHLVSITGKIKDDSYLYCKYKGLWRSITKQMKSLQQESSDCFNEYTTPEEKKRISQSKRQEIINGIASFIKLEEQTIKRERAANRFYYAWPVAYLPFNQQDVDLFLQSN